jgi:LDH2 family malate/lactate/ureidoglycolate dehydrogenase
VAAAFTPEQARRLAGQALERSGATEHVAASVAAHLVDAELAGHPSHGLRQLIWYRRQAGRGGYDLGAEPVILSRRKATTRIDAGGNLGHPALELAVDCAAEAAAEYGAGVSAVVRCGHTGRAGAWAERGVGRGAVTIVALGSRWQPFSVAAAPGAEQALQTNPIAVGVPAPGDPLLLDMATSVVAEGKIAMALARGQRVPEGTLVDRDGRPSTDPADLYAGGALLPAGGYKGFGLGAIVDALAICLTGADAAGLSPPDGALVVCLRAEEFRPLQDVEASVEVLRNRLRASGCAVEVLAPGDPEARSRADTAAIVVDDDVLAVLQE